ncbi:MAG: c-type cytochrome [Gammaproteobacteria bacterium]|nr:c-type cytochrome [Gammaproteobacteria bacterium]
MSRARLYAMSTLPALVVLMFFVGFANWIPQTRWSPPVRQAMGAEMTPAQLAQAGEKIVRERGCLTCHTLEPGAGVLGHGRGPNLIGIATRRAEGVTGGPGTLVDYLVQSLYEPGAYLVEGYANLMPASTRPPAKLDYGEVVAVVNYLLSLGATPSVRIGDVPQPPGGEKAVAAVAQAGAAPQTVPADAATLLESNQCNTCHSLKPGETLLGPSLAAKDLAEVAAANDMSPESYVMDSIVNPRALEREGFPKQVMPDNYGTQLTAAQLHVIVSYLLHGEGA